MAGFSDWFNTGWWNNALNANSVTNGFNKFSSSGYGNPYNIGNVKNFSTLGTGNVGLLSGGIGNVANNIKLGANGVNGKGLNWLGNEGIIPIGLAGIQTLGGLFDLGLGYQSYQLAQKAYQAQIDAANQNGRLQTQIHNNRLTNAGNAAIQLSGYNDDRAIAAVNDEVERRKLHWSDFG